MNKNEMLPVNSYTALKGFNLAEAMNDELSGMDVSFDRVTIPAAGGTAFELPGELPGETEAAKEFNGVILYHHPLFTYYRERFTGGNNAPDCGSYDGVTGVGDPGGSCAHCPLNQFGSGENGGKACKNKRRIYILREGELIPILLTLPTGSMKAFAVYVKRLLAKGKKTSGVVTRFSLQKAQNAGGIAYSQAQFAVARLLTEEELLYALGVVVQPPCYDTIAAAQMTLKTTFEFRALSDSGLKKLVPELLGDELPTFEDVTEGRFFDELASDDPETVRYACADSDYALRLYRRFNEWFDAYLPRHRWIVENIESPTAVYCGLMKYNGLLMDETAMIRKQGECAARLLELREKIQAMTGGVEIGANAGTQAFKDYLFKTLGLPVLKTTAKNAEAADDQTMVMLAEWCAEHRPELVPLFELVQEYRKWSKLKTTYIDGYLRFINPATGRIHPDLLPLATETGRFACRRERLYIPL